MSSINNKLIWVSLICVFALIAFDLLGNLFGGLTQTITGLLVFLLSVAVIVLFYMDLKKTNKFIKGKGETDESLRVWSILVFPYYLYRRNKLIGEKQTTFHISIVCCIVNFILPMFLGSIVPANNFEAAESKEDPFTEMKCEALQSCAETNSECSNELKRRLDLAYQIVDSIYAAGEIHNTEKILEIFHTATNCENFLSMQFDEHILYANSVDKRIDNVLPDTGCINDSLQYENFAYTIWGIEDLIKNGDTLSSNQKKFFEYLNRGCSLNYKNNSNLLITEENIVKIAMETNILSKSNGNKIFNKIFDQINNDDFEIMHAPFAGRSFEGSHSIYKKKNRTVIYEHRPSADFDDATALSVAAYYLFSYPLNSPFLLHPSVDNVEVGFSIIQTEYAWYAGYYKALYDVSIKASRKTMEQYFKDNHLNPPKMKLTEIDFSITDVDKDFLTGNRSYNEIKKWCKAKGFVCSKKLVMRYNGESIW